MALARKAHTKWLQDDATLLLAGCMEKSDTVARLGYSGTDSDPIFWVFLNVDNVDYFGETEKIFRIAHEVRKTHPDSPHIRLHVIPLDRVTEGSIPPISLLFSR